MEPVAIEVVEGSRSRAGKQFIQFPYRLYRGSRQWVPQFRMDVRHILDRRHPSFEHCEVRFLLARRGGEPVGTIGAIVNSAYNEFHHARTGHFHFFDCVDDREVSHALLGAALDWLRSKGMQKVFGPYGFGFMGMGVLVEGFEHRAVMTMMGYNGPWYGPALEAEGFAKLRDQFSMFLEADKFVLPDKVRRVAEIALKRGSFEVPDLRTKRDLVQRAQAIGKVYNDSFESHGDEYYPLTEKEIQQVTRDLVTVADPTLIKLLVSKGEIAGFLFGFPDLSAALQRARGRITPWGIVDLLLEYRRTRWLVVNGAGILPRYQRLGGNALLYYMLEKIASRKRFLYVDAVQIAETTELMLADIKTLGGKVYKVHRMYERA
ncbi:MAG TPA: hypothetical protein VMQ10_12125, partial [Spirochaetia bacterium]|nr:hypothetical protein [Spirochaetia bacterium]